MPTVLLQERDTQANVLNDGHARWTDRNAALLSFRALNAFPLRYASDGFAA
jgi:hypothetical protein